MRAIACIYNTYLLYTQIQAHTHAHTYTHTHTHTYIHTHTYTHIHTHIRTYIHSHTCTSYQMMIVFKKINNFNI